MLQAYGGDRVREQPDGSVEIQSALDKGWRASREKTGTTAEFPGTPVRWNDRWFEVTFVRRLRDGGSVYVLRPWREEHAIRNPSTYDADSERSRLEEHRAGTRRKKSTLGIAVAGLVIGHIPGHAQHEVEREYGFSAISLSLISLILPFLFAVWVASRLPIRGLPPPHASPAQLGLGIMLFCESMIRFLMIMRLSSPMGSIAGAVAYELWRMTTRTGAEFEKRAAVRAVERLRTRSTARADAATVERDAYELRAPFLALLSPGEQAELRATYGFDPRAGGLRTVVVIGLFAAAGAWSSFVKVAGGAATLWTWSSLAVAAFLLAEQVRRLTVILGGAPAGSVLGGLVRPWCRALLLKKSSALRKGSVQAAPANLPDVWTGSEPDDQNGR